MNVTKSKTEKLKKVVGRAETISFPELGYDEVPARVDTGAKTTSVWATDVREADGVLHFKLFGTGDPLYDGRELKTTWFEKTMVASSIGEAEERYKVRLLIRLKDRRIRARVTLADRTHQVYPVLVGRNVLRGKFIVDVEDGEPLYHKERKRSEELRSMRTQKG